MQKRLCSARLSEHVNARATGTRLVLSKNGVLEFIPRDNVDTHTSRKQANQPGDFGKCVAGIAGNTKLGCGLIKNRSICQIAGTVNLAFRPSGGNSVLQWSQPGLNNCAAAVWPLRKDFPNRLASFRIDPTGPMELPKRFFSFRLMNLT